LFDADKLDQVIQDPIPHKLKDVHNKVLQHSGYIEPRALPAKFERIMDYMEALYPHFNIKRGRYRMALS